MATLSPQAPIVALVHPAGFDAQPVLRSVVDAVRAADLRVAGLLQQDVPRADRRKCDMVLEDLASGRTTGISVDRGAHAEGCRLDTGRLAEATFLACQSVPGRPDLVVANKFGKAEAEGGGVRDLLTAALDLDVPAVIAVPRLNLEAWRGFSGGMAIEIDADEGAAAMAILAALGLVAAASAETERA